MAWFNSLTWFSIISFLVALIFWSKSRSNSSKLRPPGPPGWPLVGNIFDVRRMPHENFHKLRSKYGPVVWLKLGTLNTVVIQSAAAAAELFKKHDAAFSDRRVPDSLTVYDYHRSSMSQSRYGEYWRVLRRICSSELTIQKRINASAPLRQKCIEGMIQCIKEDVSGRWFVEDQELFFAATETTSDTVQWAMAELLRNPKSMRRLKTELYQVVGKSKPVQEDTLNELPYLQAVVKETMRLHPSLPFLLPRNAVQDTEFMGYIILRTQWPDRFLNSNIDNKGQHYELIPFGAGRRSCVGMLLGDRTVCLTLARLIQAFDWELPGGISRETLDLREMMSITLRMLVPLKAIPVDAPLKLDLD
ncbi:UNVERIFIED_CONTAM: Iridoid oxidase [Sesamum latifolium]|uniref:Iridoid oxidase n=1 Tax=Sesamum latifolium TaxID=2727402 RepID=A0AAW2VE26_9LAMI